MGSEEDQDWDRKYCQSFMKNLCDSQQEGLFSDVTLKVKEREFKCHKIILSSASQYFRAMFTAPMVESKADIIELKGVDSGTFSMILDYTYTGRITLNDDNVQEILKVGDQLQFTHLIAFCENFLYNSLTRYPLTGHLGILSLACAYNLKFLKTDLLIETFGQNDNLLQIVQQVSDEELQILSEEALLILLDDECFNPTNENLVYQLVVKWTNADLESRKSKFAKVLSKVRLGYCSADFLIDVVEPNPLMKGPKCQKLLHVAKNFQLKRERSHEVVSSVTAGRLFATTDRSLIVAGGYLDVQGAEPNTEVWEATGIMRDDCTEQSRFRKNSVDTKIEAGNGDQIMSMSAICIVDHSLVLTGGQDQTGQISNIVASVCRDSNDLSQCIKYICNNRMIFARVHHCTIELRGLIYIFGGMSHNHMILDTAEEMIIERDVNGIFKFNTHEEMQKMPIGVSHAMSAMHGSSVYILGGQTADGNDTGKVQVYDTDVKEWSVKAAMPVACSDAAAARCNDGIYVVGGMGRLCMCYTPITDTWTQLEKPELQHGNAPAVVWQDMIIVGGGKARDGNGELKLGVEVEFYHPDRDEWEEHGKDALPIALHSHYLFNRTGECYL